MMLGAEQQTINHNLLRCDQRAGPVQHLERWAPRFHNHGNRNPLAPVRGGVSPPRETEMGQTNEM